MFNYFYIKDKIKLQKGVKKMETIEKGKVKWFNASKGFGFINRFNDTTDIFVHYSQIKENGFKSLNTGDDVTFNVFETKNGLQAKNVCKVLNK